MSRVHDRADGVPGVPLPPAAGPAARRVARRGDRAGRAHASRGRSLLFVILLVPLALRARDAGYGRAASRASASAALVAIVLFAPWLAYNNSGRFEQPGAAVRTGSAVWSARATATAPTTDQSIGAWGGICADRVSSSPWPRGRVASRTESGLDARASSTLSDHRRPVADRDPGAGCCAPSASTTPVEDDPRRPAPPGRARRRLRDLGLRSCSTGRPARPGDRRGGGAASGGGSRCCRSSRRWSRSR